MSCFSTFSLFQVQFETAPPQPHRREALRLRSVRLQDRRPQQPQEAQDEAQRGEAVQVPTLPLLIDSVFHFQGKIVHFSSAFL